jgi:hypothetical protein
MAMPALSRRTTRLAPAPPSDAQLAMLMVRTATKASGTMRGMLSAPRHEWGESIRAAGP